MIVTVEVDPKAWELAFGEYTDQDVLDYVKYYIQGSAAATEDKAIDPSSVNVRFRRK